MWGAWSVHSNEFGGQRIICESLILSFHYIIPGCHSIGRRHLYSLEEHELLK